MTAGRNIPADDAHRIAELRKASALLNGPGGPRSETVGATYLLLCEADWLLDLAEEALRARAQRERDDLILCGTGDRNRGVSAAAEPEAKGVRAECTWCLGKGWNSDEATGRAVPCPFCAVSP
jgi:hypothetical protein